MDAQVEAPKKDGRSRARRIRCRECGVVATVYSHKAIFCGLACAKAFNVRRQKRAVLAYDIVMSGRYERKLFPGWMVKLCQLALEWREEDRAERDGRKSWYNSTHVDL